MNADFILRTTERTLQAIRKGIKDSESYVEDVMKSSNDDYIEAVVDDETAVLEDLIGVAFVISQTFISNLVSSIYRLHKYHKMKSNSKDFKTTDGTKKGIMKACSIIVPGSQFSEVQVINAFANYYKHNSEWPVDWRKLKSNSKETVKVISSVGASSGSTGNLRKATEVLKFKSYSNVLRLLHILENWSNALINSYKAELKHVGLI